MAKKARHLISPLMDDWHLEDIHTFGVDRHGFQIYLVGEPKYLGGDDLVVEEPGIDYQVSTRFMINIGLLSDIDPERPILVHMKTCGGDWQEGLAIHDSILACPNQVVFLSYTHARSMSSIVLQAADKRVLMPHSYFMFHDGTSTIDGTHKQVLNVAEWKKKVETPTMLRIYAEAMKKSPHGKFYRKPIGEIRDVLRREMDKKEDVFLTAQEAVKWGLADEVFDLDWNALR